MYRIIFILIACSWTIACTSRVVFEKPAVAIASQSAININTASASELEALPHIGPKTAEKIIQFREENGPFRRVEHVMQIRGISEKRFREIQPFLKAE